MTTETFQTELAGTKCLINVIGFVHVEGSNNAQSDLDYYGYTDYDYEVLDLRGRPAPWLEKKCSRGEIRKVIMDQFRKNCSEYWGD